MINNSICIHLHTYISNCLLAKFDIHPFTHYCLHGRAKCAGAKKESLLFIGAVHLLKIFAVAPFRQAQCLKITRSRRPADAGYAEGLMNLKSYYSGLGRKVGGDPKKYGRGRS